MTRLTPRKHPSAARTFAVDSCGCAMGARFLGVALVASIVWFAWHWSEYSLAHVAISVLLIAFAGSILGKLLGIGLYRLRTRMSRSAIARTGP